MTRANLYPTRTCWILLLLCGWLGAGSLSARAADSFPKVGEKAADFELTALNGDRVKLSNLTQQGPVVLVVLRGFPGSHCPACQQQVGQFVSRAAALEKAGANVVLVYPGSDARLQLKAQEFLGTTKLPAGFQFLLDPDYTFTNAYRLRWDEPNETAYPATFVIQPDRQITFANISQTHRGRVNPDTVLQALAPQTK